MLRWVSFNSASASLRCAPVRGRPFGRKADGVDGPFQVVLPQLAAFVPEELALEPAEERLQQQHTALAHQQPSRAQLREIEIVQLK